MDSWDCHHAPIWYLRQFLRHNISKNHRKPLNYFLSWYRIFLVQYIYWILTSFYKFFDSLALYPFGQFLAFPYLCHWSFHFYDVWYCDKIWSSYLLYSPLQKFCNNKIYRIYSSVNWKCIHAYWSLTINQNACFLTCWSDYLEYDRRIDHR